MTNKNNKSQGEKIEEVFTWELRSQVRLASKILKNIVKAEI